MAAAWVAWCRAALALAFTLAAAPFRRRRPLPGAGEVVGGGGVELGEAGAGGSSSTSSLAFILPSLVVNVREADPPASFVCRSNFSSSSSILCSESEQKRKWQSPKDTSSHFRGLNSTLNCQNSQKLSKNVKTVKKFPNYRKLLKVVKIVKIVENCQNCQNCQKMSKIVKKLSKCWSGHVSSSL